MRAFFILAFPIAAQAVVVAGNPTLIVEAELAGEHVNSAIADLDRVRLSACAGGDTLITVDAQVDLANPWSLAIPAGDWCDVTFEWDSAVVLSGNNGSGAWEVTATPFDTVVDIDPGPGVAPLSPSQTTQGVVVAGNPTLIVSLD